MFTGMNQYSAFIIIILALAASMSLNVLAATNSDPTQGMRITAAAAGPPTTCVANCVVGPTGPQGLPGP